MPRTLPEEIRPAEEVRRDQLFLATEALLSRVADERPVTLVVEDVHWADPGNNARGSGLTAQETQVLRLLAGGFTNAEIAPPSSSAPRPRASTSHTCYASYNCPTEPRPRSGPPDTD
jgi:hypothetical protein